jgi:hypothetical protein
MEVHGLEIVHKDFNSYLFRDEDINACYYGRQAFPLIQRSLRMHLTLNSQPYGRKIPGEFNEISGMEEKKGIQ